MIFNDKKSVVNDAEPKVKSKSDLIKGIIREVVGFTPKISIEKEGVYARKFPYDEIGDLILGIDPVKDRLEIFDSSFGLRGYISYLYKQRFGKELIL